MPSLAASKVPLVSTLPVASSSMTLVGATRPPAPTTVGAIAAPGPAGVTVGDTISVTLDPDDAFGEYDPKRVRMEPVSDLPPDVTVGGYLVAEQDGNEVVFRVTDIADGKAVLDGNHELAGQRLRFDATVVDVRPATQEEIAHGHIHGHGGHHH